MTLSIYLGFTVQKYNHQAFIWIGINLTVCKVT